MKSNFELLRQKIVMYEHMVASLNHKNGFILPTDQRLLKKIITDSDFSSINVN